MTTLAESEPVAPRGPVGRLYRGETSFNFIGRKRVWFVLSAVVILIGMISLGTRGLNFSIDFKGGSAWQVRAATATAGQAQTTMASVGLPDATVEVLGTGSNRTLEVQDNLGLTGAALDAKTAQVTAKLASLVHASPQDVSVENVGPTWGGDITSKAILALIVFFVLIALYISLRFEPKMALAALIAMVHDILVTVGIYSLSGFQVTPDTVIAFLTILGYSLYDTIVVFDRVRENAKDLSDTGRMTYSDMVNLSMNQTLARSINTSLVAVLPILSVLVIGARLLGATTLQDFGLALFIGLTSGAYSSIFIASPLLAIFKEREHRYEVVRARLSTRPDYVRSLTPAGAAAAVGSGAFRAGDGIGRAGDGSPSARPPRPGPMRTPSTRPGGSGPRRPPPRPRKRKRR